MLEPRRQCLPSSTGSSTLLALLPRPWVALLHSLPPVGGGCDSNNSDEALPRASVLDWSALVSHRRYRAAQYSGSVQHRFRRTGTTEHQRSALDPVQHMLALVSTVNDMGLREDVAGLQLQHLDS